MHTADSTVLTVQRDYPGYDCFIDLITGSGSQDTFRFGIEVIDAGTYWKYDLVIIRASPYKKIVLAENL